MDDPDLETDGHSDGEQPETKRPRYDHSYDNEGQNKEPDTIHTETTSTSSAAMNTDKKNDQCTMVDNEMKPPIFEGISVVSFHPESDDITTDVDDYSVETSCGPGMRSRNTTAPSSLVGMETDENNYQCTNKEREMKPSSMEIHDQEEGNVTILTPTDKPDIEQIYDQDKHVIFMDCQNMMINLVDDTATCKKNPAIKSSELRKRYENVNKNFVSTIAFEEAKSVLHNKHVVIITGKPGIGKTALAIQLLLTYKDTHEIVKLDHIQEWETKYRGEDNQIILIDDVFLNSICNRDNIETVVKRIDEIQTIVDKEASPTLVVICSETKRMSEVHSRTQHDKYKAITIDLSGQYKLTKDEKKNILREYIDKFDVRKDITENHGDLEQFLEMVADIECSAGFPRCAIMFADREHDNFKKGVNFFKQTYKYLLEEINGIQHTNEKLYLFFVFLALRQGRIFEEDLESELQDSAAIRIVNNISSITTPLTQGTVLKLAKSFDGVFFKRYTEIGAIGFFHKNYLKAVCLDFASKFETYAIRELPFEFIFNNFVTEIKSEQKGMIKIEEKDHKHFAERFVKEIVCGSIQPICQHQACNDKQFANELVLQLLKSWPIPENSFGAFELMERELEIREAFNGSLLYWAAVCGAEALCASIVAKNVYKNIKDPLWVKLQASATLVHACAHGFPESTIKHIIELGADVLCQHEIKKEYKIKFCNACALFSDVGLSPLEAVLVSNNKRKYRILNLLLKEYDEHGITSLSNTDKTMERCTRNLENALIRAVRQDDNTAANMLFGYVFANPQRSIATRKIGNGLSALWHAVSNGNAHLVQKLCDYITPAEEYDEHGNTILMQAKDVETVQLLISKFDDKYFNEENDIERTALHYVQNSDIAEIFISKGLDVNKTDIEGLTPLHISSQTETSGQLQLVQKLLERGADVYAANNDGRLPLHLTQHPDIAKTLLCHMKRENLRKCQVAMQKAFECCSKHSMLKIILEFGEREAEAFNKCDITIDLGIALLKQAKEGTLTFQLLHLFKQISNFAEVCNEDGNILHHLLRTTKQTHEIDRICEPLMQHRELVLGKDSFGNTPLHWACCLKGGGKIKLTMRKRIVEMLLEHGADVNAENRKGETALHFLCKNVCVGTLDVLDILIKHDVNMRIQSNLGESPLRLLSSVETISILNQREAKLCVETIMKKGGTTESDNINSYISPLLASSRQNIGIFEILVNHMQVDDCNCQEIDQILEYALLKPNDFNSWEVLRLLKERKLLLLNEHKPNRVCLSGESITEICNKLKIDEQQVKIMLGFEKITCHATIDKYFQYGIIFCSDLEIDMERVDEDGRTYLIRSILSCMNFIQQKKKPKRKHRSFEHFHKIMNYLLDKGVDVNHKDKNNCTALDYAIQSSEEDEDVNAILDIFITHDVDLTVGSPLLWAVSNTMSRTTVIKTLIEKGANINECDEIGRNLIFVLVKTFIDNFPRMSDISSSIRYLSHYINVKEKAKFGETVLDYAVGRFTAFNTAHMLFKSYCVHTLLECFDPKYISCQGTDRSILQKAVMDNNYRETDLIKLLIRKVGDIDDNDRNSLLHRAVLRMNHDSVKTVLYLLSEGLDVNRQDNNGNTPLHILVSKCHPNPTEQRGNLDVDHVWCGPLRLSVMKCLLLHGAQVNATNNEGDTVFHVLVRQYISYKDKNICDPKHLLIEMMSMMQSYSCDILIENRHGMTVIDTATDDENLRLCLTGEQPLEKLLLSECSLRDVTS